MSDPAAGEQRAGLHPQSLRLAPERLLALMLALLVLCGLILETTSSWPARQPVFDLWQRLKPRVPDPAFPVRIVVVDEQSLARFGQWPWPRTQLAVLLRELQALQPLAVGLDMVMPEPDRLSPAVLARAWPDLDDDLQARLMALPSNDRVLADTIAGLPVVVARVGVVDPSVTVDEHGQAVDSPPLRTAYVLQGEGGLQGLLDFPYLLTNVSVIDEAATGHGMVNSVPSTDGVVRRVPVLSVQDGNISPNLGLEVLRVALGERFLTVHAGIAGVAGVTIGESFLRTDADGALTPWFSASSPARRISAVAVMDGELPAGSLASTVVLLGVTALGTTDAPPTPVQGRMDGVEIQAQVIENLLADAALERPGWASWVELLVLALAGVTVLLLGRLRMRVCLPLSALVLLALPVAAYAAFAGQRWLLDPGYALFGALLLSSLQLLLRFAQVERRRRALAAELGRERLVRARMDGELGAAREIQNAILAASGSDARAHAGVAWHGLVVPAREVGGDLYEVVALDRQRLFFMVGDVSGKGAPAALFMALAKALVGSAARRDAASLADIVSVCAADLEHENPMMLFMTAVCGVLDAASGELELVIAGHETPLVVAGDGSVRELSGDGGPPFGALDGFEYPVERHHLAPGERLVLVTDGVTEAVNLQGELYGRANLERFLAGCGSAQAGTGIVYAQREQARQVAEALRDDVQGFSRGCEASDDLTVLVLARNPG